MEIRELLGDDQKRQVTRLILEALPDWFGIAGAREEYIRESAGKPFFCAAGRLHYRRAHEYVQVFLLVVLLNIAQRAFAAALVRVPYGYCIYMIFHPCRLRALCRFI